MGFVGGRSCRDRGRDRTGKHMSVCQGLDGEKGWGTYIRVLFRYCFLTWLSPVYFGVLVNLGLAWGSGLSS